MAETVAAVGTVTEIVTVDQGAGKYWENHLGKSSGEIILLGKYSYFIGSKSTSYDQTTTNMCV